MYRIIEEVAPIFPDNKPLYLMGVGLQVILEAVDRGVDFLIVYYLQEMVGMDMYLQSMVK